MLRGSYSAKTAILSLAFLFIILFVSNAGADTVYWRGSGDASDSANWLNQQLPVAEDDVVFDDDPSAGDCTWDISFSIKINSFSMTGYSGTVSLDEDLNIGTGGIIISSGVLEANDKTIELEGDWFYFSDMLTPLGDIDGDGDIDTSDVSSVFNMVAGTSEIFYCSDINFDSNVDILDVVLTLRKSNGYDDPTRKCTGGLFKPGTSTVRLTGTSQTIFGNTVFYNLEKTGTCSGDILYVESGSFQTVLGRLSLNGEDGCILTVQGTEEDYWYIDPRGTRNVSYVSLNYLYNFSPVEIIVTRSDPETSTENEGLNFGGSQCVCLEEFDYRVQGPGFRVQGREVC